MHQTVIREAPSIPEHSSPITPPITLSREWTVNEQINFHQYVKDFGCDFEAIATHIPTKTAAMVQEHYELLEMNDGLGIPEPPAHKTTHGNQPIPKTPRSASRAEFEQLITPNTPNEQRESKTESEMTDNSSFSAMARPKRRSVYETPTVQSNRRTTAERGLPIGERSLASLTSGIADSAYNSR